MAKASAPGLTPLWPPKGYEEPATPARNRPSILFDEPEKATVFLDLLAQGLRVEDAAYMAGTSPRTVYRVKAECREVAKAVRAEQRAASAEGRRAKLPRVNSREWVRWHFWQALKRADAMGRGHLELLLRKHALKSGKIALAILERRDPARWARRMVMPETPSEATPDLHVVRQPAPFEATADDDIHVAGAPGASLDPTAPAHPGEPDGEPVRPPRPPHSPDAFDHVPDDEGWDA